MAITLKTTRRSHGIVWKSGMIYSFRYQGWENDPSPTIILMYAVDGIHPNTGHQHRYYQGINFSYVPRVRRKAFAKAWVRLKEQNPELDFTWELVKNRFPYLKDSVRRYFFKPTYYITRATAIPFEDMEDVIVSTWSKDFSQKLRVDLAKKYRNVQGRRKQMQKGVKKKGFFSNLFGI